MKKIGSIVGYLLVALLSSGLLCNEVSAISKTELTQIVKSIIPNASPSSTTISYVSVAREIQDWIFALVGVIAVIYIVWIGAKLLWAPGNMEEVSTAMKSLGYIIIGLAIIPFAWFIISFLTNLNIH